MPKRRSSSQEEAVVADTATSGINLLKAALHQWHNLSRFARTGIERHSAIQQLLIVRASNDDRADSMLRIRQILTEAVEELKPNPAQSAPTDSTDPRWHDSVWRPYLALQVAYLDERYTTISHERRTALFLCATTTYYQLRQQGIQRLDEALHRMSAQAVTHRAFSIKSSDTKARQSWAYATPPKLPNNFVGRESLLIRARDHILAAQSQQSKIVALWGTPGMGKTAVLTCLAHDAVLKQQFPDGVLWATLGESEDGEGNTTRLLAWADAVGLSTEHLPQSLSNADLSRVLFNAIGARRFLLLVDDVWSEQALEPFNVCGPQCVLVFATRSADLAHRLSPNRTLQVEELAHDDALSLLIAVVPRVLQYEPERVEQLMARVAGWPQALQLAAAQLRVGYGDSQRRLREKLDALLSATGWDALHTIVDNSVARLPDAARELLYALSVFSAKPTSFAESAVIDIGKCEYAEIDVLTDAGLVEFHTARSIYAEPRLMIHQSVLDYARAKRDELGQGYSRQMHERFVQYFSDYTRDSALRSDTVNLSTEVDHILHAIGIADEFGCDTLHTQLVINISPFLKSRGQSGEALQMLHAAYPASQRLNARDQQIQIANELSQSYLAIDDLSQAEQWASLVVHLADTDCPTNARRSFAAALDNLAHIAKRKGDRANLVRYAQQAWAVAKTCNAQHIMERQLILLKEVTPVDGAYGDYILSQTLPTSQKATTTDPATLELQGLIVHHWQQNGIAYLEKTDLITAKAELIKALNYARRLGAPGFITNTLGFLTLLHCTLGEFDQAIATSNETFQWGADSMFARGYGFAAAFGALAHLHRGHSEHAQRCVEQGMQIATALDSADTLAWVRFAAASVHLSRNELALAEEQAQNSLLLCQQNNIVDALATMWGICGRVASAKGEFARAQTCFENEHVHAYTELQRSYAQADMGLVAAARGNLSHAETLLRAAFDYHVHTNVWRYVPLIGSVLARTLIELGKFDEGRHYGLRALQCAVEIRDVQANKIRQWLKSLP